MEMKIHETGKNSKSQKPMLYNTCTKLNILKDKRLMFTETVFETSTPTIERKQDIIHIYQAVELCSF